MLDIRRLLVLTVIAAVPLAAAAQDAAFEGEATVNVIEVPVLVVDPATGETVRGLAPEVFSIRESGRPVSLSNFSERVRGEAPRPGAQPAADDDLANNAATVAPNPVDVVYFLDLYLMVRRDRDRTVAALKELYAHGIPEGQRVSVVAFDGALETLLDRSDDPDDVLEALEELGYLRARGIQQGISFTDALSDGPVSGERNLDFYERRQRSREYLYELERRIDQVGDALSATMARHARAAGRKALVAFTPGHPRTQWSPTYAPVDVVNNSAPYPTPDMWEDVAHEAADMGFTLFTVDSSGLRTGSASDVETGITDAIAETWGRVSLYQTPESPRPEAVTGTAPDVEADDPNANNVNLGSWLERTRKNLLINAAATTGGTAFFTADVADAVESVNRAVDHWYSLAYVADHSGDGKTYTIEVELPGHPDYEVIHRTAYVDRPASERAALRLRSEMLFGGDANPLGVRVEVGEPDSSFRLGAAGSKRVRLPMELKIPYGRLELVPRGDAYWGRIMVTFLGEDKAGNQSQLASQEVEVTVGADRYDEAVARGYFSYQTVVEVEGGEQKVFVGIEDVVSGRTTIMPQVFEF